MSQRGFAPILILILIVAVTSLTGGAYYLGTKQSTVVQSSSLPSQILVSDPSPQISLSTTPIPTPIPNSIHSPLISASPTVNMPQNNVTSSPATTPGKKQYTSSTYNYSLEYPSTWSLVRQLDFEKTPEVVIKPGSGSTVLRIAVHSPYSTSGAICANQDCTPVSQVNGTINSQTFTADVVQVGGSYLFTTPLLNHRSGLNIYAEYKTVQELQIFKEILSSLKY